MIRVHRIIARMNVGGPAFHVSHLAADLPRPFETTLVTGVTGPEEADMTAFAEDLGVNIHVIPGLGRELNAFRDLRTLGALVRLFRRDRPHIVHTHTAKAGALGRLAAVLAGVPVRIHTYHGHVLGGGYFSKRKTAFFRGLEAQLARITQTLVVLTHDQAREMSEDLAVAECDAFRVIPLGLDLGRFLSIRRDDCPSAKDSLRLPHGPFLVACVGRMVPIKRHDLLLRALALVASNDDESRRTDLRPLHIVMVGGGEQEAELRTLCGELGISDRVHWLGWKEDITPVLTACDATVLSSDDEGTPVAILESLAAGLPVAATRVGGVAESVAGFSGVVLCDAGDPLLLAKSLAQLRDASISISTADRQAVVAQFSVERLVADVETLYRSELRQAGVLC